MAPPDYEIYAIKYGERVGTRGQTFVGGDPHDAPLAMDYFVWVLRHGADATVVDVGFSRQEGERRGRTFLRCPGDGLKLIGVDPDTVRNVIITHMHYDHAGNLALFPNACFHIQDDEMAYVTGRAMTHKRLRHSFALPDVLNMVSLVYGDRVAFHDGEDEILPGVNVHPMPGHSRGLQSLTVSTARGTVVVASDGAHYYESLTDETAFMTHENMFKMVESFRKIRKLAASDDHIIPGHDPLVLTKYPAPHPDLEGIVARLDVAPVA